jgi:excisionase family DNA binding protein
MYSIPELAQKLGVHRATVHRWVRKGLLPATQVGTGRKIYLIPEEALKLCPKKRVSNSKETQPTQPQLF